MKKVTIIASMILVSITAFSQAKVEVGLKGGLNMSSISSDQSAVDFSNKTGYHFGAYGLIKVLSFGIQPEILYSTKGADVSAQNVAADFSQDFTYVDIPVMFKLYTVAGLNVQAGPQFGMLVSAGGKDANGDKIDKSDFKDSDISAAFGLGWDAPFGLNLTARYILGLSDINPNSDSKNRTFQLSVGYKLFGLGK
ncbi:MAG: porin family protein [Cyclobacteriaceae bacterium]